MPTPDPFDAVILAGGAARRMAGADKPGITLAGRTLLERVAAGVSDAQRLVVVGPERPAPKARYVREDPPGSGPVPALRAGLEPVSAPWLALLAGDLPFLDSGHVTALRRAAARGDGAVAVDAEGHPQWLLGVWRAAALRSALADYTGSSLRGLLRPLRPELVTPRGTDDLTAFDCDTPEQLARARALLERPDHT